MTLKRSASTELVHAHVPPRPRPQIHQRVQSWTGGTITMTMQNPPTSPEASMILDRRLSYRVGSPLLAPLPLRTEGNLDFDGLLELRPKIARTLHEENVTVQHWECTKRYCDGQTPGEVSHTLLIMADSYEPGQTDCWARATRRLRNLLDTVHPWCSVEIIDYGAVDGLVTEIIPPTCQLLELWPDLSLAIIKEIDEQRWRAVELLVRRFDREEGRQRPTVVITAADAQNDIWWTKLLPDLRQKVPASVQVELLCVSHVVTTTGETSARRKIRQIPDAAVTADAYQESVRMGASVGLKATRKSRTLGGFIELEKDGRSSRFGLSNHHVLGDSPHPWNRTGWLEPGHPLVSSKVLEVMSPSDTDDQCLRERTTHDMSRYKMLNHEAGRKIEKSEREINQSQRLIELAETTMAATKRNRMIGTVHAASGWRTVDFDDLFDEETVKSWAKVSTEATVYDDDDIKDLIKKQDRLGWCMDWALVANTSPRNISNEIPAVIDAVKILPLAEMDGYINIDFSHKIYQVAKIGRTTGWTTGSINCAASYLNMRDDETSSVIAINPSHRYKHVGVACGIISSNKHKDFLAPGDSGSVVLLNQDLGFSAYAVGLGFASNIASLVSYMIPYDLVVRDIQKVTGATVVQPRFYDVKF